jgi:hypothetical protein
MSYGIELSVLARHNLESLPLNVRRYTIQQLEALSENPTVLSERSHFPFEGKGQRFSFDYAHEGEEWEIHILFQYNTNETSLYIGRIGKSIKPG